MLVPTFLSLVSSRSTQSLNLNSRNAILQYAMRCSSSFAVDDRAGTGRSLSVDSSSSSNPANLREQGRSNSKLRIKESYSSTGVHTHLIPPHLTVHENYSQLFLVRTRWIAHTLAAGIHIPRQLLNKLLAHRSTDPALLEIWVEVLARKDLIWAAGRLGLLESGGEGRERIDCPTWLFLALPSLLQSTHDAPYLVSLLLSPEFRKMNEQNRGLFVARAVQAFLKVHHWVALREVIDWICADRKVIHGSKSFARILTALAAHQSRAGTLAGPSRDLLSPVVNQLRQSMRERATVMDIAVFSPLFTASLIPADPQEATNLLLEMESHRIGIRIDMIHAVMAVYARAGQPVGAGILRESIKEVRRRRDVLAFGPRPRGVSWTELDSPIVNVGRSKRLRGVGEAVVVEASAVADEEGCDMDEVLDKADFDYSESSGGSHVPSPVPSPSSTPPSNVHNPPPQQNNRPRPRTDAIYHNTQLVSFSHDLPSAFRYFDQLQYNAHHSSSQNQLPLPDTPTWTTLLSILARSSSVSAGQLMAVLRQYEQAAIREESTDFHSSRHVARPTTRMYTVVMNGLNERDEPEQVMLLWDEIAARGYAPDAWMLTSIAKAMIMLGEVLKVEAFLIRFALPRDGLKRRLPRSGTRLRSRRSQEQHANQKSSDVYDEVSSPSQQLDSHVLFAKSVPIDVVPINLLLSGYNRSGHYHSAWSLWLTMESSLGVCGDAATISILLDTARYASAAAGRGFGPGEERLVLPGGEAGVGNWVDDTWSGKPAWMTMRSLVGEVLEGNWPELVKELEDPLQGEGFLSALRRRFRSSAPSSTHLSEVFSPLSLSTSNQSGDSHGTPSRHFIATLSVDPAPRYPYLHPSPRLFRSLIQLLGYHSTPSSILPLLGWMKALGIKPERTTVGLALLYIGEGGLKEAELNKIRAWLEEWVGAGLVPSEGEIAALRRGGKRGSYR